MVELRVPAQAIELEQRRAIETMLHTQDHQAQIIGGGVTFMPASEKWWKCLRLTAVKAAGAHVSGAITCDHTQSNVADARLR